MIETKTTLLEALKPRRSLGARSIASGLPTASGATPASRRRASTRFRCERRGSLEGPLARPPGLERFYYGRCVARITGWTGLTHPRGRRTQCHSLAAITPLVTRTGLPARAGDTLPAHQGRSLLLLTSSGTEPGTDLLVTGACSAYPWRGVGWGKTPSLDSDRHDSLESGQRSCPFAFLRSHSWDEGATGR